MQVSSDEDSSDEEFHLAQVMFVSWLSCFNMCQSRYEAKSKELYVHNLERRHGVLQLLVLLALMYTMYVCVFYSMYGNNQISVIKCRVLWTVIIGIFLRCDQCG